MTPQVVTETVFALVHLGEPWIPTEVHIITTSTGAHRAKLLLLAPGQDQFGSLCREYALPPIAFDVNNIHVVANADGQKLEDVRNQADNMAVADMILSKMAGFAADRTCAMHVSLAGGRKSMGFFAGYALSLYGRAQDRLSHVLVSPGFETHPEFFFPPKTPRVLLTQGGTPVSTSDARIELADIPFVRLRDRLPDELLSGGRFADAVAAAQRLEAAPRLRVDLASRSVQCADTKIRLAPMNFAVYAWLAKRRLEKGPGAVPVADFNAIHSSLRNELYCFGCKLFDNPMSAEGSQWRDRRWNDDSEDHGQWLAERRSRINEAIRRELGRAGERIYGIESIEIGHRRRQHQVGLPPECVNLIAR